MKQARAAVLIALAALAAGGCLMTAEIPDPNSNSLIGLRPEIMQRNLASAWSGLERRRQRGEIDEAGRDKLYQNKVEELTRLIPAKIEDEKAWIYGDVYRDAKKWPQAKALYEQAVRAARTEDRRVNDHLRLSRAQAALGQVKEAAATARETFSAPAPEKAPILPAILYEVVPAGRGKGADADLARVLADAISQHMEVQVDPASEAGQAFLSARTFHVQKAWTAVVSLYEAAGQRSEARKAMEKFESERRRTASV
jgi:tetratricopeptide (TPR) repeat protein